MSAARFALVCLDTWQIETFAAPVRIVDLNDLAGDEYVPDGDDYADDVRVIDLAREHGVPVADLWAAYKREQQRESAGEWIHDGDAWQHCGRPSHYDDDTNEQVCSKCSASFSWDDDGESVS